MTLRSRILLALAAAVWPLAEGRASPPELKAVLDFAARPRLLDTHFARFGAAGAQAVSKEPGGFRVRVPAAAGGVGQSGVYSYFAMAGDLEITADYELVAVPAPRGGHGAALSFTLDTCGPAGAVSIARGYHPTQGHAYWVTRATPDGGTTKYEPRYFPASGKRGKVSLRRQGGVLTVRVADGHTTLGEIAEIPFPAVTVRQLRVAADPGGSPTQVDVRVTGLTVRAEEVTGGIPVLETRGSWWRAGLGLLAAIGVAALALRWWRRRRVAELAPQQGDQPDRSGTGGRRAPTAGTA